MSKMFQIYVFELSGDKPVRVEFWGPREWLDMKANHGGERHIREKWVKSIIRSFPDAWRDLPDHDFIQFLSRQGMKYEEYLIRPTSVDVTILCRTTAHI